MCRLVTLLVIVVASASAPPLHAQQQQYPSWPIRFIIPFPPGDALDTMSRLISPALTARLEQNIIVDNRARAAGQLGLEQATQPRQPRGLP